jgi:4-diphosphocytidyl-2-C-methyl-D-erythritol kinase
MTWLAPAKLNLFLHIVGRRPDGYHLLQTVFQFIDYYDELEFRVTDDGRVSRAREPADISFDSDLSIRAARLLQEATGCGNGVEIALTKRIPIGAGLGGGSSDAATTLLALNDLWDLGLSIDALASLGLKLGADVPVFVRGRAAFAEGVGELLTPVDLPEPWYVVVIPPVQVKTADVYGAFAGERGLTPYTPPPTIRDLHAGRGGNDLERIARARYDEVEQAFRWLSSHGRVSMSGSGGAVFVEVPRAEAGRAILASLPRDFAGFVARGMNRHPLLREARR